MIMHFQEDFFHDRELAVPTAEGSTIATTWFAVMEERRRLACEIHDTLAQAFAGILLHLEAVPKRVAAGGQLGSGSVKRLARARHLAKCGLEDSRRMLLGLRPKSLDGNTLAGALKALAQRCASEWRIVCKFRFIGQETELSPDVQNEFYRIAQEALCNVHKHARATSVSIILSCKPSIVALTVKDNGQGFVDKEPKTASEGFGLSLMRERALRIGGSMDICTAPRRGAGVRVRVLLPGIASKG
jgi:two-component system sensor histidine kinase/response regulator